MRLVVEIGREEYVCKVGAHYLNAREGWNGLKGSKVAVRAHQEWSEVKRSKACG